MSTLEKIKTEIINEKGTFPKEHYVRLIDKYAEQEKDAYDKVIEYLKANVDDFPDYHEAIEAVLKMKGGE